MITHIFKGALATVPYNKFCYNHYMPTNIEKKLIDMENLSHFLNEQLKLCKFGKTKKQSIFLAYYHMNLEYIISIHLLIRQQIYGVPAALVRLHLETLYRALWVNYCATSDEIDKINIGKFKFKSIGFMASAIDIYLNNNNAYKNIKNNYWKEMCEYTHTGTTQLAKRFNNNILEANYSEEFILGMLEGTEFILQEFVLHLLKEHNYNNELKNVLDYFVIKY